MKKTATAIILTLLAFPASLEAGVMPLLHDEAACSTVESVVGEEFAADGDEWKVMTHRGEMGIAQAHGFAKEVEGVTSPIFGSLRSLRGQEAVVTSVKRAGDGGYVTAVAREGGGFVVVSRSFSCDAE